MHQKRWQMRPNLVTPTTSCDRQSVDSKRWITIWYQRIFLEYLSARWNALEKSGRRYPNFPFIRERKVRPCQTLIPFSGALMHLCRSAQAIRGATSERTIARDLNQTDFGDTKIGAASSIAHGKRHMEPETR
jgi:hypothetical protein